MCAIEAGKRGRKVILLDKANKAGRKILISGGGRCNFTNLYITPEAYLSNNTHFCKSALARYTQWDFMQFMEQHHLSWQEKTLGQLFCEQKAKAVVNALLEECRQFDISLQLETHIEQIQKTDDFKLIIRQQNNYREIHSTSLVIATGGPSIPKMGASDFGVQIAKQFNIKNIPFKPGLVPLTFPPQQLENFFRELAGISLPVEACCNGKCFKEHMLFTHRGLSGPAILQISSYWQKNDPIILNLLPDTDTLEWLQQEKLNHPQTELKNTLAKKLPKRLALRLCETHFSNQPLKHYQPQQLQHIAQQLSHFELTPSGTEGMRTAEVSLGGIDVNELSSKTFETRKVAGLYFIGETVDVTGHLGGFNFQWAWSSGWCAGQYV